MKIGIRKVSATQFRIEEISKLLTGRVRVPLQEFRRILYGGDDPIIF